MTKSANAERHDDELEGTASHGESVLERAFRVLGAFDSQWDELGLTELTRRANLPKSTVHRLASQLVELGALERSGDRYELGMLLFKMGSSVTRQRRIREAALPLLEDLYEATHETVHLGVLDGLAVLYLDKIAGRRVTPVQTRIGTRQPLHCTALGKVILAFSPDAIIERILSGPLPRQSPRTIRSPELLMRELQAIAKAGVAYDHEEYALGIVCVSAPVFDRFGYAYAALSVTGPSGRFRAENIAGDVRKAASRLSLALGGRSTDHSVPSILRAPRPRVAGIA